jgi:hypothetical protein
LILSAHYPAQKRQMRQPLDRNYLHVDGAGWQGCIATT